MPDDERKSQDDAYEIRYYGGGGGGGGPRQKWNIIWDLKTRLMKQQVINILRDVIVFKYIWNL